MSAPAGRSFPVTWTELHRDTRALAWRLADLGPFEAIVAIPRGGLVPAAIVARELGIRRVETVCIASYEERLQGEPRILPRLDGDGTGLLVIDDLTDTVGTDRVIRSMPNGRPT